MSKGVEKVSLVNPNDGNLIANHGSSFFILQADKKVDFHVKYYDDTPMNLRGNAKWIIKPTDKYPIVKSDKQIHLGDSIGITIPAKYCGVKAYMLEAFLYSPESKYPAMIVFSGRASQRIISTAWSKTKGGTNIKNRSPIKYGDDIWLNVKTEGLNGAVVDVSVYNRELGKDDIIYTYTGIKCYDGEINLNIKNTFSWKSKAVSFFTSSVEDFYVKITLSGSKKFIIDNYGDDKHAVCLKIENKVSSRTIEQSEYSLPLKIGKLDVDVERYDPCKYSKIIIKQDKRDDYLFFDETKNEGGGIYSVIAGNKDKAVISINVDSLITNPETYCAKKGGHKGNVFTFNKELKKWVKEKKDDELKLEIQYQYPNFTLKDKSGLKVLTDYTQNIFIPLEYIWPARKGMIQKYSFHVSTCRYQKHININVFPDIEWAIQFFYNTKNPVIYRDSWVKMTQYRIKDAYNKAQAGDIDGYDNALIMKFGLKLTAKWNNGADEAELGKEWSKKIEKFLLYFLKLKRLISSLIHEDKVPKKGLSAKILQRLKRKPITIEVFAPGISFDIGWKLQNGKDNESINKVGTLVSGKLKFAPLIKGAGRLDLFAVAETVPAIGQVVKALDIALSAINVDPIFDLKLKGEIFVEFDFEYDTSRGKLQKGEGKIEGKFGVYIELSVKAQGKVDAIIFEADYSFEAKGTAESYFIPRLGMGADDEGIYIDASVDFTGIKAKLVIKAESEGWEYQKQLIEKVIVEEKLNMLGKKYYINK